jgi:hypothetical protein
VKALAGAFCSITIKARSSQPRLGLNSVSTRSRPMTDAAAAKACAVASDG